MSTQLTHADFTPTTKISSVSLHVPNTHRSGAGPSRLLPKIIDYNASTNPTKVYAVLPTSGTLADGMRELNYKDFSNAINRAAYWLDSILGKTDIFDTFAYLGSKDVRYAILAVAAIKTGRKAFFPSPFGSKQGFTSLLEVTKCSVILSPGVVPAIPLVQQTLADRPDVRYIPMLTMNELLDDKQKPYYPYEKTFEQAEEDPFMILHTSGTTGNPKPLFYTNGAVATCDAHRYMSEEDGPMWWHLFTGKRVFSPMPTLHVAGIFSSLIFPIFYDHSIVLGPGDTPLTLELVNHIHSLGFCDGGLYPPSILEEIAKSSDALQVLKRLQFVAFAGAPLSNAAGDTLSSYCKVHNMLGSTELGAYPVYLAEHSDWASFRFHPWFGYHMEPIGDSRYELIIRKNPELRAYQSVFHLYPTAEEYHTRDLFASHPTRPGLWIYERRLDDLIILSHGEDLDPIRMEAAIRQHPLISDVVIGGDGRNKPFALIEFPPTVNGLRSDDAIIDEIWPTLVEANKLCSEYVRLTRERVIFTLSDKPLRRTIKRTIDRRKSLAEYKEEINMLYLKLELGSAEILKETAAVELKELPVFF